MKNFLMVLGVLVLAVVFVVLGVVNGWFGTWFGNKVEFTNRKIDDVTSYETLKEVEDSCRAMIASYEADRLSYEQYKGSDSAEKQTWAEQAKMRANRTAANYNNYILKNSFVWDGNIPVDILNELPYLD